MSNLDKHVAKAAVASSQHRDANKKGIDGMRKMKTLNSIKFSDRSPPTRKSSSQTGKQSLMHFPTTAASLQKHELLVRRSPNYMKPTISSDAKKEVLPVSLQNTRSGSDGMNLPQKCLSNSTSSSASNKKTTRILSPSSNMNSVQTLMMIPSFKPCTDSLRKYTTTVLRADIYALARATCSSTLKDPKFPAHLMLHPGGTESEGASIMKLCPYTYCSLNGNHHHPPLPQFNCIILARKCLLETQRSIKLEAPESFKVSSETTKGFGFEHIVFDESDSCNPVIAPWIREIGTNFVVETYAKEREEADKMRKSKFVKHLEDQEGIAFATEGNGDVAEEKGVKQVTPCVPCDIPKSEINPKEDFKTYFDGAAIQANTNGHQEPNAGDAEENQPPSCFHDEICTGIYFREVSNDRKHMENIELDDSDSQGADMECEEEQFCPLNYEEDIGSSIITVTPKKTHSKFKSSSESSHDISEIWLDDILSNSYADIIVKKDLQESKEEKSACFEAQPRDINSVQESTSKSIEFRSQQTEYQHNDIGYEYDQSSLEEAEFQYMGNTRDNDREIEKHVDNEVRGASMVLYGYTVEKGDGHKICEIRRIEDNNTNLENNDKEISQTNQIPLYHVPVESNTIVQDQELLNKDQVRASKFQTINHTGDEEQNTHRRCIAKQKRHVQDVEEMRKINLRKPNLLPLVPDTEPEKVELKHHMMDDRKNAEEWMLDFALRQAVTKHATAGKKKVALLVEAFETVMSAPKCETHVRTNSPFAQARPIQACS